MPLRRRRNQQQPSGPAYNVPPAATSPVTTTRPPVPSPDQPIGVRPRWQVQRLKATAHEWRDMAESDPAGDRQDEGIWLRGVIAAASWALGELEAAPISGARTGLGVIPDVDLMEDEDDKAEWALRHPREAGYSYSYANGVQHCLMWITGDTDDSPIGFDD